MNTYRIGPIRPPSEAQSLLLQVTQGCTWNKCKFCNLYRHTRFRAYTIDSIKEDIDCMAQYAERVMLHRSAEGIWDVEALNAELQSLSDEEMDCYYIVARWLMDGGKSVFLQDGNTLALRGGRLPEVLRYLRKVFPQIERITSYGRAENLSKVSQQEFAELKEAGLDRIHSGFESGSDQVLQMVNKGVTSQQQITAGKNIKAGGLELSVYFMPGLGGKKLTVENAAGMAHVVSEVNPDFVRIRTTAVKPGTELYEDWKNGDFVLCSEEDKLREIRTLIMDTQGVTTRLVSDHVVNLLQAVRGRLDADKHKMLSVIDEYLELPEDQRRLFQIARRLGHVVSLEEMDRMPEEQIRQYRKIMEALPDQAQWDRKMNDLIGGYI